MYCNEIIVYSRMVHIQLQIIRIEDVETGLKYPQQKQYCKTYTLLQEKVIVFCRNFAGMYMQDSCKVLQNARKRPFLAIMHESCKIPLQDHFYWVQSYNIFSHIANICHRSYIQLAIALMTSYSHAYKLQTTSLHFKLSGNDYTPLLAVSVNDQPVCTVATSQGYTRSVLHENKCSEFASESN